MHEANDEELPSLLPTGWMVGSRWFAYAVLGALLVLDGLGAELWWHASIVLVVLGTGLVSNAWLELRLKRGSPVRTSRLAGLLCLDLALLTTLFSTWGGSGNPYTSLYAFPVILGALVVRPWQSWMVLGFAIVAYGGLFVFFPADLHHHDASAMRLHLAGMFVSFVLTGALVVFAVDRVRRHRLEVEHRMVAARELEARQRRLTSLATLAAGAAHELATPLSTVWIVARELERRAPTERIRQDMILVGEEVARCRKILSHLSASGGAIRGEGMRRISLRELIDGALSEEGRIGVEFRIGPGEVWIPVELMEQVLRRLVDNARQAGGADTGIVVTSEIVGPQYVLQVEDRGEGMSDGVLERAMEPFFTTKGDAGMGLGLYFVRSVVRQLEGELRIRSKPGEGTCVTLTLPTRGSGGGR